MTMTETGTPSLPEWVQPDALPEGLYEGLAEICESAPGKGDARIDVRHEHRLPPRHLDLRADLRPPLRRRLRAGLRRLPGLPAPRTNRTHCIAWSDYTSQAEVALANLRPEVLTADNTIRVAREPMPFPMVYLAQKSSGAEP